MTNKLVFNILILLVCSFTTSAQKKSDTESLNDMINTFQAAFSDPTKEQQFYDLFLHDAVTWAAVYEGKTKEALKSKDGYKSTLPGNFKEFYNYLKSEGTCTEDFYNIMVNTDNNHATVIFDYTFKKKDEIQNWGKEYWTLLKVEGNWKIASVLWTMNYQSIEKCPFTNNSYYRKSKF